MGGDRPKTPEGDCPKALKAGSRRLCSDAAPRHDSTPSFFVPSGAASSSRGAPRDAFPPTPRPDASTIERGGAAPDASPLVTPLPTTPATKPSDARREGHLRRPPPWAAALRRSPAASIVCTSRRLHSDAASQRLRYGLWFGRRSRRSPSREGALDARRTRTRRQLARHAAQRRPRPLPSRDTAHDPIS